MRCLKDFGERIASRDPDRQTAEIHIRDALINRFNTLGLTAAPVEAMLIALEQLGNSGHRPNLRMINEMLDRAEGLERRPVVH